MCCLVTMAFRPPLAFAKQPSAMPPPMMGVTGIESPDDLAAIAGTAGFGRFAATGAVGEGSAGVGTDIGLASVSLPSAMPTPLALPEGLVPGGLTYDAAATTLNLNRELHEGFLDAIGAD